MGCFRLKIIIKKCNYLFTSMFVERMEVLEYRQKFGVELSTFPGSSNTEKQIFRGHLTKELID